MPSSSSESAQTSASALPQRDHVAVQILPHPNPNSSSKSTLSSLSRWGIMKLVYSMIIAIVFIVSYDELEHEFGDGQLWSWLLMLLFLPFFRFPTTFWIVSFTIFFIRQCVPLQAEGFYVIYIMKTSMINWLCPASLLLAWMLTVRGRQKNPLVQHISRFLMGCCVASFIWLLKIYVVIILASSRNDELRNRLEKNVFVTQMLEDLGKICEVVPPNQAPPVAPAPMAAEAERARFEQCAFRRLMVRAAESVKRLKRWVMSQLNWWLGKMKRGFQIEMPEFDSTEEETLQFAERIFKNVARRENEYIIREDLLRFLKEEDVNKLLLVFREHLHDEKVGKAAFQNWMLEEIAMLKTFGQLQVTKGKAQDLHSLANVVAIVLIAFVIGVSVGNAVAATITFVVLLLRAFWETIHDYLISVYMIRPFDIGDLCVIDGQQVTVQEVKKWSVILLIVETNTLTQIPYSELSKKSVVNISRSKDICEMIEFSVDRSISKDIIENKIKIYIQSKPEHWDPDYCKVLLKEIKSDKNKMVLRIMHKRFKNFLEKEERASDLRAAISDILAHI